MLMTAMVVMMMMVMTLMCAHLLKHAIAHGGCADTIRVLSGSGLWERNPLPHQGLELVSVLRLAFRLDALVTKLFPPV